MPALRSNLFASRFGIGLAKWICSFSLLKLVSTEVVPVLELRMKTNFFVTIMFIKLLSNVKLMELGML